MSIPTLSFEELHARYQLLCRCTRVEPQATSELEQQIQPHLQRLEELLSNDLRALARQGSPGDFVDIYFALQQALENFRELCFFPGMANKKLVAFGGGFSAGKSSLINALLGEHILEVGIDPTTSLPTYLMHSNNDFIQARNLFDQRIDLSQEEFRSLTHDEVNEYGINISRMLHSALIGRENFPWENLVMVDTPGYTKYEYPSHNNCTDEQLARNQLNQAQAIVWVIDARKGCITEDDLKFLESLKSNIPRLIVLIRADQKLADEVESIVVSIKNTLEERKLPFINVVAVSAKKMQNWPLDNVLKQLAAWNLMPTELPLCAEFFSQFYLYRRFFRVKTKEKQKQISKINKIIATSDSSDVISLAKELKAGK